MLDRSLLQSRPQMEMSASPTLAVALLRLNPLYFKQVSGYLDWTALKWAFQVWRTCRQIRTALPQLAAASATRRHASNVVSGQTRLATKLTTPRLLFWTGSRRTRIQNRVRGIMKLRQILLLPPLLNMRGRWEVRDVQETTSGTLCGHSPTPDCSQHNRLTLAVILQLPVDDHTPVRTALSVSPTLPISAGTSYGTAESDCTPVSSATRASSLRQSSPCTSARTRGSGLSPALSAENALPAAATWGPTSETFTWGRGRLLVQSVGKDFPTRETWGFIITESIKEIPATLMVSRSLTWARMLLQSNRNRKKQTKIKLFLSTVAPVWCFWSFLV